MSMGTKVFLIIALIQLIVLLLLYNKMEAIERSIELDVRAHQTPTNRSVINDATAPMYSVNESTYPGEHEIRQIIREELAAQADGRTMADSAVDQTSKQESDDWAELERRRAQVSEQLLYYKSVGSISDVDMRRLQAEIARLDPNGQRQMLMELNRALNSGQLEGRL